MINGIRITHAGLEYIRSPIEIDHLKCSEDRQLPRTYKQG